MWEVSASPSLGLFLFLFPLSASTPMNSRPMRACRAMTVSPTRFLRDTGILFDHDTVGYGISTRVPFHQWNIAVTPSRSISKVNTEKRGCIHYSISCLIESLEVEVALPPRRVLLSLLRFEYELFSRLCHLFFLPCYVPVFDVCVACLLICWSFILNKTFFLK